MATRKALVGLAAVAAISALALTACSGTSGDSSSSSSGKVSGDIKFLTNRTDLKTDGTWDRYIKEFNKKFPDVKVTVEAHTNYEDDLKTLMSTPNGYGDALLIPDAVGVDQFSEFFQPLGSLSDLEKKYRFVADKAVDGKVYGIAIGGNAAGVVYNKAVWKKAGITALPTTPSEFLGDLKLIKEKTNAVPYYTNYKDGWPLAGQWTDQFAGVAGSDQFENKMATDKSPWSSGKPAAVVDGLLYDIVHDGLSESDPLTTNWEQSKGEFAQGKIATMVLGSWAVSQFQAAATAAGTSPADVGFMAFPTTTGGKQYSKIGGDKRMAVNVHSKNQAAAQAWIEFLANDSDFSAKQGMVSPSKAVTTLPANLESLTKAKVEMFENVPAPADQAGLLNNVADASKVDIWGNIYRQKLVDTARGQASGDKSSFFAQLNQQWGAAVAQLAK